MAKFRIQHVFTLEDQGVLVLAGENLDGTLKAGKRVEVIDPNGEGYNLPVKRVEFVRLVGGDERVALLVDLNIIPCAINDNPSVLEGRTVDVGTF